MQRLFMHMNRHVPAKRRSLADLLKEERPVYFGKDDREYVLDPEELRTIAGLLDEDEHSRLKIPILIVTDTNYGEGYWKVMGRLDVKVLSRLIGREPEREDEMRIFYPYLQDIRRALPTATNTMFSY